MASFTNFSLTTDFPTTLSPNNTASKLTNNISPEVMQRELIVFILTTIFVSFGMIGIGATVDYKVVLKYLKKPHAYALGVFIQLACVPPLAWALTKIFQMPRAEALGVMIQGSCPGGTISNLVVFWTGGVIDLSVAMTATTTLLSLGTMPMWLFIFSKVEELPVNLLVPFDKLGILLASLILPLALGMTVRTKFPKKAELVTKICVGTLTLFIIISVIVTSILRKIPWIFTWKQIVVACLMPILAFGIGFLPALLPCLEVDNRCRRTVAVEIALQNVQVAGSIIQISFGAIPAVLVKTVLFPFLYGVFQLVYSITMGLVMIVGRRHGWLGDDETVYKLDDARRQVAITSVAKENVAYKNDVDIAINTV
ncbi:ileal sodium/bile acid cotransporter-like isoform X1 [Clavelina lepadiformis]|uniref:ileal sodium/bile acid cotransporter-like isoform X1 n=1 Tax=Clavelina lepadiformis TaxID=159417 RepID=UPI004042EE35